MSVSGTVQALVRSVSSEFYLIKASGLEPGSQPEHRIPNTRAGKQQKCGEPSVLLMLYAYCIFEVPCLGFGCAELKSISAAARAQAWMLGPFEEDTQRLLDVLTILFRCDIR